jgi:AcrR family transcriptional regulator
MASAPPIRRRNAPATKARILEAAQRAFAQWGFARAGIRDIAAIAGVSSPMLLRYFGSKAGLFEAALVDGMQLAELFSVGRESFGANLAALLTNLEADVRSPAIVALATGDAEAQAITARVTEAQIIVPLAAWLGEPFGRARALEIVMVATGFVTYARQIPLPAATPDEASHLTGWLAATIQAIVDRSNN